MSIPQTNTVVKTELYQPNSDRAAILELADDALAQANRHKAEWLATNDATAWRLWQAAEADRAALLGEVGR